MSQETATPKLPQPSGSCAVKKLSSVNASIVYNQEQGLKMFASDMCDTSFSAEAPIDLQRSTYSGSSARSSPECRHACEEEDDATTTYQCH